ncbi:hypothetical protein MKW92_043227 [Papaver armeniacum]|nr:hypothetical protein MKW92_043227 [Papaver armeniacum]
MRQFATIHARYLLQHKLAWPFMQPVDVKGLKLHDYYEVRYIFTLLRTISCFQYAPGVLIIGIWLFLLVGFGYSQCELIASCDDY